MQIYLNGQIKEVAGNEDILEPGFLFGWGAFETIRVYNGKVKFLEDHLARLKSGLALQGLELPKEEYLKVIQDLLVANNLVDAYVRITVFNKRKGPGLIIQVAEFNYYNNDLYKRGVKLIMAPFTRSTKDPFLNVKSISYAKNRVAWLAAQKQNKDEALFFSDEGFVQEGARSNIFFVQKCVVFTPSVASGVLDGVTRRKVFDICRASKITYHEGEYLKDAILGAEEAFITSSLMGVMLVSEIAGVQFKLENYQFTPVIMEKYRELLAKD